MLGTTNIKLEVQLENTRLEQQATKFFINRKQTFFGPKKKQINVVRRGYGLEDREIGLTFLAGAETDMTCHLLEPRLCSRETVTPPSVCFLRVWRRRGTGIIFDLNVPVGNHHQCSISGTSPFQGPGVFFKIFRD